MFKPKSPLTTSDYYPAIDQRHPPHRLPAPSRKGASVVVHLHPKAASPPAYNGNMSASPTWPPLMHLVEEQFNGEVRQGHIIA
eukprot:1191938-Prorocentrum_minimum.AAC.2